MEQAIITPSCGTGTLDPMDAEKVFEITSGLSISMREKYGFKILVVAGPKDLKLAQAVIKHIHYPVINLAARTSVSQLASVLKRCRLFISNDSGPAHLASSFGINTIVLFGPTLPEITAPRSERVKIFQDDIGCKLPCYQIDCPDNRCMQSISVEQIFATVKRIFDSITKN